MKALTLTFLSLAATAAMAADDIERTLDADANGTVSVNNISGMVDIRGWSRNEVQLIADLGSGVEEVRFERSGQEIEIEVKIPRNRHHSGSTDLEIRIPQNNSIKVSGVSVDIEVRDVLGVQQLVSVSGDIVSDAAAADVEVETVSGDIELQGDNKTMVSDLNSVSGDIDAQSLAGEVTANSVSGDVAVIDSSFSRARMQTTSGDIVFNARLLDSGRLNIETINGDVEVDFEDSIEARFDIESFNGMIDNCFGPEPVKTSQYTPGTELKFTEGNGNSRVSIKTLNGDLNMCRD